MKEGPGGPKGRRGRAADNQGRTTSRKGGAVCQNRGVRPGSPRSFKG